MEEIMTPPQVAQYLKMSKAKVYSLIQRGELPHIRIGRNVRVREADLHQWIEKHLEASLT